MPGAEQIRMEMSALNGLKIWTIGHSTRSLAEFLQLLDVNRIETVADVRSYPGSRRYPQFNAETLSGSLAEHGIGYIALKQLGGGAIQAGFTEHCLAKPLLSRICRLYGNAGVQGRHRRVGPDRKNKPNSPNVRRSRLVAMSPFNDIRLSEGLRRRGRTHNGRPERGPSIHICGAVIDGMLVYGEGE